MVEPMSQAPLGLITGASSGIGWQLAKVLAADGYDLVLVARREDALQRLARQLEQSHGISAHVKSLDLAATDAAKRLVDWLNHQELQVDLLVNNAGFGARGRVVDLADARQRAMMQLNMITLFELTRILVPEMVGRGRGGVINVASTAAFQPGPFMAVYYATKAFVLSFSEALGEELVGTGVRVTCLAPGPVATGFGSEAGVEDTLLFRSRVLEAKTVAEAAYRAHRRGRSLVVPGFRNKLGVLAIRLMPRVLTRKLLSRLQR